MVFHAIATRHASAFDARIAASGRRLPTKLDDHEGSNRVSLQFMIKLLDDGPNVRVVLVQDFLARYGRHSDHGCSPAKREHVVFEGMRNPPLS